MLSLVNLQVVCEVNNRANVKILICFYPISYLRVAVTQPWVVTQSDPVILNNDDVISETCYKESSHLVTLQEERQVPGDPCQEVVIHLQTPLRPEAEYLGVQPCQFVVRENQGGDLFVISPLQV